MTIDLERTARDMNLLAAFLGARSVPALTQAALHGRYGITKADVMALFGGSILAGGDVLAQAMRNDVAACYVIVGGRGHTTEALRQTVRELVPEVPVTGDESEAEIFEAYLEARHGLHANLLETSSTDCGSNVTCLRDLLVREGVPCDTLVLAQDATMQARMAAVTRKEMPRTEAISYATYRVRVVVRDGTLAIEDPPLGMWEPRRYLTLLMGEIPRLTDDEGGYGPRGRDFLAHVDVPPAVREAWEELRRAYPDSVRQAVPRGEG